MTSKARAKVPKTATFGEIVTVRTSLRHRMESGHRRDADGRLVPRRIVNLFQAEFDGEIVCEATIGTAVAANPYIEFDMRVTRSGVLRLTWRDDGGDVVTLEKPIEVV